MTITFFSNFLNSHQLPLCNALMDIIGIENFRFVATTPISKDRIAFGFEDMNNTHSFVIRAYESDDAKSEAQRLSIESDVAIIGSAPYCYINERLSYNKLTFIYSERLFKRGTWMLFYPPKANRCFNRYTKQRRKNAYVLCASAFTKGDLKYCFFPSEKCFKWGYFPEVKKQNCEELFVKKENYRRSINRKVSILWAGRLIGWKHPEIAILLAKKLSANGVSFHMNIIGGGKLENDIKESVVNNSLSDKVFFLGSKTSQEVRQYMEQSDIFLFTSDKNEGWGVVLNEAMNSGCAVIANQEIGSVPYLLKDGQNGLTYRNQRDINTLLEKVVWLTDNPYKIQQLGQKAYESLENIWNANVAANNLLRLIESINNNKQCPIEIGPCSHA